ncbi:DUF485 domain-containing protein [Streptomyces sp. NPDC002133]|uniref:DUF485 domain-containing protein n=1 Tax=Streptomyces sp. NPDC002133 TaxID=3154409 RepID=UPI003325E891
MSYDHVFPEPSHSAQHPWHTPPPPVPPSAAHGLAYGAAHHLAGDGAHERAEDGDLPRLRSGYRRLRRVATLTALGYFTLFLVLSGYAPGLMTGELSGGLTTGLFLGLCQLPVTLAAIALYERIARRRVDPLATAIRLRAEEAAEAAVAVAAARQVRQNRHGRPGASAWQRPTGGMRA